MKNLLRSIEKVRKTKEGIERDNFIILPTVDSTMRVINDAIRDRKPDNYTAIALHQSQGTGGRDPNSGQVRTWWSGDGNLTQGNLMMSRLIHLKPHESFLEISLMSSCAVLEVVKQILPGKEVKAKWQNDVLVEGRKVAGQKTEFLDDKFDARIVNLGVGVNIGCTPPVDAMAKSATYLPTSLRDMGSTSADVGEFVILFNKHFDDLRQEYAQSQRFDMALVRLGFAQPGDGKIRMQDNKNEQRIYMGRYVGGHREKGLGDSNKDFIHVEVPGGLIQKLSVTDYTLRPPQPRTMAYGRTRPTGPRYG